MSATAPATDAARQWDGWGTALKPAYEPIILARKPLSERNVAANVLKHGTGGINVGACRIEGQWSTWHRKDGSINPSAGFANEYVGGNVRPEHVRNPEHPAGRWPANVLLDEEAAAMLDAQSGERPGMASQVDTKETPSRYFGLDKHPGIRYGRGDSGGASRFFYCAKADSAERNGSRHPTVKPLDLMRYLCRLITPPNGIILDPFAGTATTLEAAHLEGFGAIGIEQSEEYCADAQRRLGKYLL